MSIAYNKDLVDKNILHGYAPNRILKNPPKIKADIVDGTLTIYAGSIFIVPYGTDAPTYSVGDFLLGEANNNLYKIVDIQYDPTDDTPELYYWCELQRDVSQTAPATSSTTVTRFVALNISGELNSSGQEQPLLYNTRSWSEDTLPNDSNSYQWYQPTNNKCVHVTTSHVIDYEVQSFPILKVVNSSTQVYGEIVRIFNGRGYIGCARWYDKDIVGVAPAGIDLDGTYKNIVSKLNKLVLVNGGTADKTYIDRVRLPREGVKPLVATRQYRFTKEVESYSELASLDLNNLWCVYVKNDNLIYINNATTKEWEISFAVYTSQFYINSSGVIEDFQPYQPLRIADANDLDGKWQTVADPYIVFEKISFSANQTRTYDLSSYLPNDNNVYEVLFFCFGNTGTTSGNNILIWLQSSICPKTVIICNQTRTASAVIAQGSLSIPIGQDRILTVSSANQAGTCTNVGLHVKCIRKVR